jgi:hypothetical protein
MTLLMSSGHDPCRDCYVPLARPLAGWRVYIGGTIPIGNLGLVSNRRHVTNRHFWIWH